jgi:hypothetical protein
MSNKPRRVGNEIIEEVHTGLSLVLLQHPEGAGAFDVWEALFKNKLSCSSVSSAISELERNGFAKFVGWTGKRKKFVLTDKEFKLSPAMALNGSSTRKMPGMIDGRYGDHYEPKKGKPVPNDNPADPEYWLTDLNAVVSALCILQERIPSLKAGLLDLTKNLERLAKVKEIVGDVAKVARRNV